MFYFTSLAPSEILARGRIAIDAYRRALLEGKGYARRVPVMIIGQARTGKTSLKRSLKGELFNPNEGSTKGIETDPSYLKSRQTFGGRARIAKIPNQSQRFRLNIRQPNG